ncbi:MAG TPA: N-acetyltransferase [Candidatus Sulfotelmatobacter sp.]
MSIPVDTLTFWTGLGAAGSLGALWLIYYQIRTARRTSAYSFLLRENERFRSHRMTQYRAELAQLLITKRPVHELEHCAKHVANYFESLGLMVHEQLIPKEFVWESVGIRIFHYWNALQPYVEYKRQKADDRRIYERFDELYKSMAEVDKLERGSPHLPSTTDVVDFLARELQIKYREYSPKDVEGVVRIFKCSLRKWETLPESEIEKADLQGPDTFLVAQRFHEIIGFIMGHIEHKRIGEVTHQIAQITTIAVDPGYRGLGIGKALLEKVLARFEYHGTDECVVRVRKENDVAMKLLLDAGFRTDLAIKIPSSQPHKAECVMMRKSMKETLEEESVDELVSRTAA